MPLRSVSVRYVCVVQLLMCLTRNTGESVVYFSAYRSAPPRSQRGIQSKHPILDGNFFFFGTVFMIMSIKSFRRYFPGHFSMINRRVLQTSGKAPIVASGPTFGHLRYYRHARSQTCRGTIAQCTRHIPGWYLPFLE